MNTMQEICTTERGGTVLGGGGFRPQILLNHINSHQVFQALKDCAKTEPLHEK